MRYIFIGASAACVSAAHTLAKHDPQAELVILTQQREYPNNTCSIKHVLAGLWPKEQTFLRLPTHAQLYLQQKVIEIDPDKKRVVTQNGQVFDYDTVIIGIGTRPRIPELFKAYLHKGVFTYHTLDDVEDIVGYSASTNVTSVAIIGGGLSGVEAALACRQRGLTVTLIEKEPKILSYESEDIQKNLENALYDADIQMICAAHVTNCIRHTHQFEVSVDTRKVVVDMVVLTLGGGPDSSFLHSVGEMNSDGYILKVRPQYELSCKVVGDCTAQPRVRNGWSRAIMAGKKILA